MAVHSIGTGGDFATIALWVADAGRISGDIGELKNEVFDEHVTIDVDNLTLRPETGAGHDGTFGSGARVIPSTAGPSFIVSNGTFTIEDIEVQTGPSNTNSAIVPSADVTARRCLFKKHDSQGGANGDAFSAGANITITTENCVFYNLSGRSYDASSSTITVNEKNCTHYSLIAGASIASMNNSGNWTFEGSLFAATASSAFSGDAGTSLDVLDCIFDNAEVTTNFDTNTNNTFSATFQWGSGGSGTRVMFDDSEPNFHLLYHADNAAQNYIPAARAPYVSDDFTKEARPAGASDANAAGADEPLITTTTSVGAWSAAANFAAGDAYRITIDGPAANQVKISATLEFEE